jgi:uncharacterized membrane protein
MNDLTNDQNIENLKKRKYLRIIIIVFSLITILLAALSLITEIFDVGFKFSFIFSLISYLVVFFLTRKRNSIVIKKNEKIEEVRRELDKNKKLNKKGKK